MGTCIPSVAEGVEGAVVQTIELNCDVSAAVNDLVRVSLTVDEKAEVATANDQPNPVIGRIKEKLTDTRCIVVLAGVIDVIPAPAKGRVYLSLTGGFDTAIPTTGYMQELGYSFGNGKVRLQPEQTVTKRS